MLLTKYNSELLGSLSHFSYVLETGPRVLRIVNNIITLIMVHVVFSKSFIENLERGLSHIDLVF